MSTWRKILTDPSLWALIAFNLIVIFEYHNDASEYTTIIWLYWCQSVLIGFFTFLDLVTIPRHHNTDSAPSSSGRPGCIPWFFVLHYGTFHFVYLIFLFADHNIADIHFTEFKWALLSLIITYVFYFIQNKIRYAAVPRVPLLMLIMPYLRIVPMHLTIILPKFYDWKPALIFLILKPSWTLSAICSPRHIIGRRPKTSFNL